jgi:regulator of cell morphogenesis and NO signaling
MNATESTLGAVCDHILADHHDPLKASLPRIKLTLLKVADAHGRRHPELYRLLAAFARFADDLTRHLGEEDHVVFPLVGELGPDATPPADLRERVEALEAAHARVGEALAELRALTARFAPPADACDTYRALMGALRDLDAGVRRSVREEHEVYCRCGCGRG